MHLGQVDPQAMIRGGAIDDDHDGNGCDVPLVDFVSMLENHFQEEDYVVVKMDIEGGEFTIMDRLIKNRTGYLIDVLALECHWWAGDCNRLLEDWEAMRTNTKLLQEGSGGYDGWDSESTPDKYYPIDPRGRT